MPKEKKSSFFGKLMGGEETTGVSVPQPQPEEQEAYVQETQDEGEEVDTDSQEPDEEEQVQGSTESEEWLSEYEGELNIDMYQTKDNVIIKSTIAGVRSEDLDITIANDMLTIRGERKREEKISQEDYFYQECYWGGFSRSVILPVDVDIDSIEADLKDGILTVILPKAAKAKTKKIRVKS
jgi:HSP20 family protein